VPQRPSAADPASSETERNPPVESPNDHQIRKQLVTRGYNQLSDEINQKLMHHKNKWTLNLVKLVLAPRIRRRLACLRPID
jgi:hypothetical protein